jgi:ribosomal protein S21|tara:strand:+ start:944 stop:1144 length:201 start_codon:yes stop_codon:yes gene_type:complete
MSRGVNVSVKPRRNDHNDKLVRKFNKKVKKQKIMEQVRERRYYMKPSERKRLQKKRSDAKKRKESN